MLLDHPADDGAEAATGELGLAQQQSSLSDLSGTSSHDASLQPNMALVVGELKGGLLVGVKAAVGRIMQVRAICLSLGCKSAVFFLGCLPYSSIPVAMCQLHRVKGHAVLCRAVVTWCIRSVRRLQCDWMQKQDCLPSRTLGSSHTSTWRILIPRLMLKLM